MTTVTGFAPFGLYQTWYQVSGDVNGSTRPLIVLHGGPGVTHLYMSPHADLTTKFDIPVVLYDQLGCGKSTWLPEKGGEFWTVDLFLSELDNLINHLGILEYDVLGHSWGGMLAAEHAVRRPPGLGRLVLVSGPSEMSVMSAEMDRLIGGLPTETREALKKHEDEGTTDSPEYQAACQVFYAKHLCRVDPPRELQETFAALAENSHVYGIMNGPSEFHIIGTLKDWKITDRLYSIFAKTLLINGEFDEITDKNLLPFVEGLSDVEWVKLQGASHMQHFEQPEKYLDVVSKFLAV